MRGRGGGREGEGDTQADSEFGWEMMSHALPQLHSVVPIFEFIKHK